MLRAAFPRPVILSEAKDLNLEFFHQVKQHCVEMLHPECFGVQHDKRAADLELARFLLAQERRKG